MVAFGVWTYKCVITIRYNCLKGFCGNLCYLSRAVHPACSVVFHFSGLFAESSSSAFRVIKTARVREIKCHILSTPSSSHLRPDWGHKILERAIYSFGFAASDRTNPAQIRAPEKRNYSCASPKPIDVIHGNPKSGCYQFFC